jgi:serpin B
MCRIIKSAVVVLSASLLVAVMSFDQVSVGEAFIKDEQLTIAEGNNAFTIALYGLLRAEEGNLFFSPFSIRTAFAMAYGGAKGDTAAQMASVLFFPSDQTGFHSEMGAFIDDLNSSGGRKYLLAVANALWGQKGYPFLGEFLKLNKENYRAGLKLVDFENETEQARQTINKWVERKTFKRIQELLKEGVLSQGTVLVLTNAIYFKGTWVSQFSKDNTVDGNFTKLDGSVVTVPFMNQTGGFGFYEDGAVKVLEMPYEGDRMAMAIILPVKSNGLGELEQSLTAKMLEQWLGGIEQTSVVLKLPKFTFTSEFELSERLKSLGMVDAFEAGRADFTGITKLPELFISAVVHKALVDVNEKGTVAAGATAIVFNKASFPSQEFIADRPFLFLIRDTTTGAILFMGRMADPRGE